MERIKDNRQYFDRKAKELFSLPTFEDLPSKLMLEDDSIMREEEYEAEEKLRAALANRLRSYLKENGLYSEHLSKHIIRFVISERDFALCRDMYSCECTKCPHFKERYKAMLNTHDAALTALGLLTATDKA